MLLPLLFFTGLVASQIPPELTRGFDNNTIDLVASFDGNEVDDGSKLKLADTKSVPTFALGDSSGINTNARYIVVCIDPDAPSRANPTRAQVLHYMNTDFSPSGQGVRLNSSNSEPTLAWAPPGPPEGTGEHRYVFLLYRQRPRRGFQVKGVPAEGERTGFNVSAWREENNLKPAVAGTFFTAEFGDEGAESANGTSSGSPNATASSDAANSTAGVGGSASGSGGAGAAVPSDSDAAQTTAAANSTDAGSGVAGIHAGGFKWAVMGLLGIAIGVQVWL